VAGVGLMEYRRFVFYNVAGGAAWVTSMTWAGYLLGQAVPNIGDHIHVVVGIVILLSLIPILVELIRERRRRSA
jgi:membrane-associated protein